MSGNRSFEIKARLSGLFYRSPEPESPAFVVVGTEVSKGQVVGLLESMKLFITIKSPDEATVVEILVDNEEAVSAGQVLMRLARGNG